MTAARSFHTASLLMDGSVLIAGGYGAGNSATTTAELYDPLTGVFTPTGDMIEPQGWQPYEMFDGPSLWGHERLNLPEDQREKMRQMRLDAAARGVRAPLPPINCAWLDSVRAQH